LATLGRAITKTPTRRTIVMRGGSYRESVNSISRKVTIQAYPNEQPWLDGRQIVTGFNAAGSTWVQPGMGLGFVRDVLRRTRRSRVRADGGLPEMVFFDGLPQRQVAALSAVVRGTFYVDFTKPRLYTGSNPSGHVVEATVLAKALQFDTAGASGSSCWALA